MLPIEIKCAKIFDYNLGIKLIRGAYMNEERELALKHGYESPVFETIECTHKNYNQNLDLVIRSMT